MPIRPDLRKYYVGPAWQATRKRILTRYENRCCQCGKPNGEIVFTYTWKTRDLRFNGGWRYHMVWLRRRVWRDQNGNPVPRDQWPAKGLPRRIKVQISVGHRDNDSSNMDGANLRAWCNWCHLHADAGHHKASRSARRDRARPILEASIQTGHVETH